MPRHKKRHARKLNALAKQLAREKGDKTPTGVNRPNPGPAPTYRDDNPEPYTGEKNGRTYQARYGTDEPPFDGFGQRARDQQAYPLRKRPGAEEVPPGTSGGSQDGNASEGLVG